MEEVSMAAALRRLRLIVASALVSLVLAPAAMAAPITITFDAGDPIGGLAVGETLGVQYQGVGVTFSPNAFSGPGGPTGDWATNTDMTIVSSTGGDVGGLGLPLLVSGNLLRSFDGWLGEDGDASFRAIFSTPITTLSATFAGLALDSSARLLAFNGSTLLDTATPPADSLGQHVLTVSSATPITSVVFRPGDFEDWVGVDTITFEQVQKPVPEPTSLVLIGMGLAGSRLIRRRRA